MSDIEVELQNFIKNTILTLACCNNIDHRNYDRKKQFSRLKKLATNNSIDNSINIIVKEILERQILNNKDDDDKEDDDQEDDEQDDDDEKYNCIFTKFIDYIGLKEIHNLHGDSRDIFYFDFIKIIKKHNF